MPNLPASKSSTRQKISRKDKPPVSTTRFGNKFLTSGQDYWSKTFSRLFNPVKRLGKRQKKHLKRLEQESQIGHWTDIWSRLNEREQKINLAKAREIL